MSFVKIKSHPDFIKDTQTGAILNTNKNKLDEYNAKKKMIASTHEIRQEINNVMNKLKEVEELKKDIDEIKNLLRGLVK